MQLRRSLIDPPLTRADCLRVSSYGFVAAGTISIIGGLTSGYPTGIFWIYLGGMLDALAIIVYSLAKIDSLDRR